MNVRGKHPRTSQSAFTLVELIVVMTLLVIVVSVAAPSLAGFFRGRAVNAEARRMLSLTRLGQSRAVSEGVPMILWVDTTEKKYGLEEDSSFTDNDTKAMEYGFDGNVTVEIGGNDTARSAFTANTLFGSLQSSSKHASLPQIRFQPDGSIDEVSREAFRLMDRDGGSLSLTISSNRMNYEIQSQSNLRPTSR
jgi:prepilin-type N-terminal cleavage/methylation domain-containing protein